MPLTVKCPNAECGKSYQIALEHSGKRGRCKSCGTEFVFGGGGSSSDGESAVSSASGTAVGGTPSGRSTSAERDKPSARGSAPTRLGRFRIQDRVGVGGFGVVYRAQDPQLQRMVALKLLKSTGDESHDKPRIERFLLEGRAAARLQHPNIVPVFDAGKDEESGEYYLAAAFITGQSLASMVKEGPLEPRRAATITAQVARALAYAHGLGILHRDVKPDNVMVDEAGTPHLMDFGLARMEDAESKVTHDGAVMGTASYMSPEQGVGDQTAIGPASDQYSLGCLLHELLTGATPFEGPVFAQLHHHDRTEAPAPSSKNKAVPRDLDTICLKTMAKEPNKRYADCAALAVDLERWLADEPILAREWTLWERAQRWRRRNPAVAALSVGLALALMVGLLGVTTQWLRAEGHARAALRAAAEERTAKEAADTAKSAAEKAKAVAETAQAAAEAAEARAVKDREAAREAAAENKRIAYSAHMNLAQQAWDEGNVDVIHDLLDRYLPVSGEEDLRCFEWRHWWQVSHGFRKRLSVPGQAVTDVCLSPDEKLVAVATTDDQVRLREWETGTVVATLSGHNAAILAMAFSADGRQIATVSIDATVRLWDVATGRPLGIKSGDGARLTGVTFDPAGRSILFSGQRIWTWTLATDEVSSAAMGLNHSVGTSTGTFVGFSRDGGRLAIAGSVWDTRTGLRVFEIPAPPGPSTAVAFSPDGQRLATGAWDNQVRIWDLESKQLIHLLEGHTNHIFDVAWSADGRTVASTGRDLTVRLWDPETGKERACLKGHAGRVSTVSISADGNRVVSGGRDYHATLWDVAAVKGSARVLDQSYVVLATAFAEGDKTILSGGKTEPTHSKLCVWDAETGRSRAQWDHPGGIKAIAAHPAGKLAATLSVDHWARVWNLESGQEVARFRAESVGDGASMTRSLAFSPDGQFLVTHGEKRGSLNLWDHADKTLVRTFEGDGSDATGASFSPDGHRLAAGNIDAVIRVWDVATGKLVRKIPGHSERVWTTAFSKDGKILATAGADMRVKLWNVADGSLRNDLTGHTDTITWLTFAPDGKTLASTAGDGTVKVWDSLTGQLKTTLLGHVGYNYCVAFSADGTSLVSGGIDGTVRVWRTATDTQIRADRERR